MEVPQTEAIYRGILFIEGFQHVGYGDRHPRFPADRQIEEQGMRPISANLSKKCTKYGI